MTDAVTTDRTKTSAEAEAPTQATRTRTIDEVVEESGHLRSVTRLLGDDVTDLHHRAFEAQLNVKAREEAKRPPTEMLNELARLGFSWRDIARLIGVSVPAVRRWRQGEVPTGGHLLAIARLRALVEILSVEHALSSVASWMEMPLAAGSQGTGLDLAAAGRFADLIDIAAGHASPDAVLDRWQPGWRQEPPSDFEVFEAADAELGIRLARREEP